MAPRFDVDSRCLFAANFSAEQAHNEARGARAARCMSQRKLKKY
jgi:hypothetical protein